MQQRLTNSLFPLPILAQKPPVRLMTDDGQAHREDDAPEGFSNFPEVSPEEKDEEAYDREGDWAFDAGGELMGQCASDERRNNEEDLCLKIHREEATYQGDEI